MSQASGMNHFLELPVSALTTEDAQRTALMSVFKHLRLDETKPTEHTGRQQEYNTDITQTHEVSKGSGGLSLRPFCQFF